MHALQTVVCHRDEDRSVIFDISQLPIAVATWRGVPTPTLLDALDSWWLPLVARCVRQRRRVVLLEDAEALPVPSPEIASRLAAVDGAAEVLVGRVFVVRSLARRSAITALAWIGRDRPRVAKSMRAGVELCRELLGASGPLGVAEPH